MVLLKDALVTDDTIEKTKTGTWGGGRVGDAVWGFHVCDLFQEQYLWEEAIRAEIFLASHQSSDDSAVAGLKTVAC